jgi:hypothetical protein
MREDITSAEHTHICCADVRHRDVTVEQPDICRPKKESRSQVNAEPHGMNLAHRLSI